MLPSVISIRTSRRRTSLAQRPASRHLVSARGQRQKSADKSCPNLAVCAPDLPSSPRDTMAHNGRAWVPKVLPGRPNKSLPSRELTAMADSNNGNHNESSRILNMTNGGQDVSGKRVSTDLHKASSTSPERFVPLPTGKLAPSAPRRLWPPIEGPERKLAGNGSGKLPTSG